MKLQTEINNEWRTIHKMYNNKNGTYDQDDMKKAIEALIKMNLDIEFHVPLLNAYPDFADE